MRRTGVTVVERKLRYRWEWGFDPETLPDPRKNLGLTREVVVRPFQRAREKGIDLSIGMDVVDLAKPVILPQYDFTTQLRYDDFEAASDSFDYSNPLPEKLTNAFVELCESSS